MIKIFNNSCLSLKNSSWVLSEVSDDIVSEISRRFDLPDFIARLLHLRGVGVDDVENFLSPTLKNNFPDPLVLAGMKGLARDMAQAISDKKKIAVFADFDVDGATSAAILTRFFRHFGMDVPVYIPERLVEGYGPSGEALQALKDQGAEIVIIADCGITAHAAVQAGRDMGLEVIVLDHHDQGETLPNASHIINPKRTDDTSGLDMLAACGVCFMTCVAINSALREQGYFQANGMSEPPLKSWMDILAVGTVCDMVPLTGVNRLFVRMGFEQMVRGNNPGLVALRAVAGLNDAPKISDAGWQIGPRINAGSRVHRSDLGAKLLSTDDADEAQSIAWTLEKCNEERKEIQSAMLSASLARVERDRLNEDPVIIVDDENGHPGLSGLVAGKIKERFSKPAIVITYAENPAGQREGRGSGRSVPGIDMGQLFRAAETQGVIVKGGGHKMAAGFTVMPDRVEDFKKFLISEVNSQRQDMDRVDELTIDAVATLRGANVSFIKLLETQIGPFGVGNAEPVFALNGLKIHSADVLKEKHIRIQMSDWEGGTRTKAMLFGGMGTPLGDALLKGREKPFQLAGRFVINSWQGRESVEFHILDGAYADVTGAHIQPLPERKMAL